MRRAFFATTTTELKLLLREPAAGIFVLGLPLLLLMMNSSHGNVPDPALGGAGALDILVPGYIALVIATMGLMMLPVTLAGYREQGVLRRQRATPLSPTVLLAAHVVVALLVTLVGVGLLVAVGMAAFDLRAPQDLGVTAASLLLSAVAIYALGFLLAGFAPTARTAQALAAGLYFPMIFLSGATWPRFAMSETLQRLGDALPLTYAVQAMQDPWTGSGVHLTAMIVLALTAIVSVAISARTFRWE
jgi:ABC-2 type transport system permease protein